MSERLQRLLLENQKNQRKQSIRQMIGYVTDDSPFTVRLRGKERDDLVYLAGYLPMIGDRVLVLQKGAEPPIVLGKLGGGAAASSSPNSISVIEFFGHSGIYGGASNETRGMDTRLASIYGAEAINRSRGGARLSWHEGTSIHGGWAHLYRYVNPGTYDKAPYDAKREAVVIWFGENDLATLGPPATNLSPYTWALKAVISRVRAATVFEETDASVTYPTGTWSNNDGGDLDGSSNLLFASGAAYKSASSGTISVAVPSDFPGGNVALAFLSGSGGEGASLTFTVDGVAAGSLDTRNTNAKDYLTGSNAKATPAVKRFTGLSAGSHTIVATITAVQTACLFDGWWIEAPDPPIVVVPGGWETDTSVPLFQFFDLGGFPYVPVAGDVATMDGLTEDICDEFDEDVIFVEVNSVLNRDPVNFADDHIHPSDRGHALVAVEIAAAIDTRAKTRIAQAKSKAIAPYISSTAYDSDRNVIESVSPTAVPLTLRGRRSGDQFDPLLDLDGAGSFPHLRISRNVATEDDVYLAVADAAAQVLDDTEAGDTALAVADNTKAVRIGVYGEPAELVIDDAGVTTPTTPTTASHVATKGYVDGLVSYTRWCPPYVGAVAVGTSPTANTAYFAELVIPHSGTITGVEFRPQNATGNVKAILYNAGGTIVARTTTGVALAGSGLGAQQKVAFASAYAAVPGVYHLGLAFNNAGSTYVSILTHRGGTVGSSYTTPVNITPPTNMSPTLPYMHLY